LLLVTGGFRFAGAVYSPGIAAWNGTEWLPVDRPSFVPATAAIEQLTILNGDIVAVTGVPTQGGSTEWRVIRRGESGWEFVGPPLPRRPNHLASFQNELYGAVYGGAQAERLFRLVDDAWVPAGSGYTQFVTSMVSDGERLYVGGFSGSLQSTGAVRVWDGVSWSAITPPNFGAPNELLYRDGKIYAAGNHLLNGISCGAACWDGSEWQRLSGTPAYARMAFYGQGLVATRVASSNGEIYIFEDGAWRVLTSVSGGQRIISRLYEYRGELVVLGTFDSIGSLQVMNAARWDGESPRSMGDGFGRSVGAAVVHQGDLYVSGAFTNLGNQELFGIARWDGEQWSDVGGGLRDFVAGAFEVRPAFVLASDGSELLAVTTGPGSTLRVRKWDGASWSGMGGPLSGAAFALTKFDGSWILGGSFSAIDGVQVNGLARWNGTTWEPFPQLLGATSGSIRVQALAEYGGRLIVGGRFNRAGDVVVSQIASWDGSAWASIGLDLVDTFSPYIQALLVKDNTLFAAGQFHAVHDQPDGMPTTTESIIAWNGERWQPLGGGVDLTSSTLAAGVVEIAEHDGSVIVIGSFDRAGGADANRVARWDGQAWHPLNNGLRSPGVTSDLPRSIVVHNDSVVVSGDFYTAGTAVAAYLARWRFNEPTITWQPVDTSVMLDHDTVLTGHIGGPAGWTIQWYRGDEPIADGMTPWGSFISGSTTTELSVSAAGYNDGGDYWFRVSTDCGVLESLPATLTIVPPPCAADANDDSMVNGADLSVLLFRFGSKVTPGSAPDFNADGVVDAADLSILLATFGQSC